MLKIVSFLASLLVYFQYVELPPIIYGMCQLRIDKSNLSIDSLAIKTCDKFQVEDLTLGNETATVEALKLKSSDEWVAKLGHMEGLKPESYRVSLTFRNKTHYEGSVEITAAVIEKTDRIVLNRHVKAPEIDYEKIYIRSLCEEEKEAMCIEKISLLNDSFVVKLSKWLQPGEKYQIIIPSFRSKIWDEFGETGSVGLSGSGGEEQGYWGLTTIFQMRYARTVFPCFDHPSMKAKFQLCLNHQSGWRAASNMPLARSEKATWHGTDSNLSNLHDEMIRSCFQETPIIPSYVFTMALMENYTLTTLPNMDGPTIELYSPNPKVSDLAWIGDSAKRAMDKMKAITNFTYPLPKLSIYVTYPAPFWGIENFGLVTTEGAFMEQGERSGKASTILNHEMVHQWLGDVATISDWREICLQEGLTAFLEWNLSQDLQNVSMDGQAAEARGGQRDYTPFLTQFNKTQDIADRCFGFPPLFFKLISDTYGFDTWQKFLNKLLTRKAFNNADVKYWDQLLVESTGDQQLNGYLESWFGQSGFAHLFVSVQNEREIQIMQGRVEDFDHIVITNETVRPIPVTIITSDGQFKNATVPKVQNFTIKMENLVKDGYVLVDPDGLVMARKVYQVKTYGKFLCKDGSQTTCDNKILTQSRLKSIWNDFCQSLLVDAFPWGQDEMEFKSDEWVPLFHGLIKGKLVGSYCRCCISTEEENKQNKNCAWQWNRECTQLRINKLLGRNYTLPNESPFEVPDWGNEIEE